MTVTLTGPTLTTERLTLRLPQASDFETLAAFFETDRSKFVGGPERDRGKSWRIFGHIVGHWPLRGWGSFVIDLGDGKPAGMVGPWFPEGWPEREIGWSLWSQEHEGNGYIVEAMSAIYPYIWNDLGWDTAVSNIEPDNAASIRTAERLGATLDPNAEGPDETDLVYRHKPGGYPK
ncbi:GNAT family N-acetyltransferase [Aestuariibius insulae]|uniref:GNAT family N-acetyltransferase n=1 Tax=Aestuariibius insulae TaxID=2058287 RepID=UPI00345E3698